MATDTNTKSKAAENAVEEATEPAVKEAKVSELRSVLADLVRGSMAPKLAELAKRADALLAEGVTEDAKEADAFGVVWEAGKFLNPKDPRVQALAVEAAQLGLTRRQVTLALNFHRPSAFDRALKGAKRETGKATAAKAEPKKAGAKAS